MRGSRIGKLVVIGVAMLTLGGGQAKAQHVFDGNILWDNYKAGVPLNLTRLGSATFDAVGLYNHFAHNDSINPLLGDPYNKTAPNWVPAEASPASGRIDDVVDPVIYARECDAQSCDNPEIWAAIERTCYRGAVPPASFGSDWTQGGWIYNNPDGGLGRTDINYGKPLVILQGDLAADYTMVSTNNYLLRGRINVLAGATLTIEPGTVIFGEKATLGFLNIERSATIIAEGTVAQPIVFTSDQVPGQMAAGDFGGLVINGRAIANCADCLGGQSCVSEGTSAVHCGTIDCDSSGRLRYVRVEYAGFEIAPNNELNAFTFNSVGSGTRVEYLNAFRGLDDLFEWFGGKVTCKYLVGQGGGDDGLDWQMGFRGRVQFAVIQQWGDGGSDKGIEADNNEFNYDAPCRSNPVFANLTLTNTDHLVGSSTNGIHFRRGTDAHIYNSIIVGWKDTGLRVQNDQTSARGFFADPPVLCRPADVLPGASTSGLICRTFPNPTTSSAHFYLNIPVSGRTRLAVYDPEGRQVADIVDRELSIGAHQLVWDIPADLPSGMYLYRLQSGGEILNGRLTTIR